MRFQYSFFARATGFEPAASNNGAEMPQAAAAAERKTAPESSGAVLV